MDGKRRRDLLRDLRLQLRRAAQPEPALDLALHRRHHVGVAVPQHHRGVVVAEVHVPVAVDVPDVAALRPGDVVRVGRRPVGTLDDAARHDRHAPLPLGARLGRPGPVLLDKRLLRPRHVVLLGRADTWVGPYGCIRAGPARRPARHPRPCESPGSCRPPWAGRHVGRPLRLYLRLGQTWGRPLRLCIRAGRARRPARRRRPCESPGSCCPPWAGRHVGRPLRLY